MTGRNCQCGSGLMRFANYDARGIFLCFTCETCHQKKMATYRKEVLVNPNYDCDEAIDSD